MPCVRLLLCFNVSVVWRTRISWFKAVSLDFTTVRSKCGHIQQQAFFLFFSPNNQKPPFEVYSLQEKVWVKMWPFFLPKLHSFLSPCASVQQSVGPLLGQKQVGRRKTLRRRKKKSRLQTVKWNVRVRVWERAEENEQWKFKSLNQKNKKFIRVRQREDEDKWEILE